MAEAWKEFQDLVARIERLAAPRGAIVKSPDYLEDINTGSRREVDASIRLTVGVSSLLIVVECRRHNDPQDVTWVEQLTSKRRSVGADLMIAASARGFTAPAKKLAGREGIQLRILSDLTDDEIDRWLSPVHHIVPQLNIAGWRLKLYDRSDSDDLVNLLSPSVVKKLEQDGWDAKIFHRPQTDEFVSCTDLFSRLYAERGTAVFDDAPDDGGHVTKLVTVNVERHALTVETTRGPQDVETVEMKTELSLRRTLIPAARAVSYDSPEAQLLRHGQFEIDANGETIRLIQQKTREPGDPSFAVEVRREGEDQFRPAGLEYIRSSRRKKPN